MGATPPPSCLPVIDLSELDGPQHDRVVESIVDASKRHGWFQVVNHGMPVAFLEELKESAYRFFNQSEERKAVYIVEEKEGTHARYVPGAGLGPVNVLVMAGGHDEEHCLKHWPDACKETAVKYQKFAGDLADRILRLLLNDLGVKVDECMIDLYMSEREPTMNYFPISPNGNLGITAVHKHTDPYTLTVLLQDHVSGLFAKLDHGEWVQVELIPGALIIITGDILEVISNGKYKAVEHYAQTTGRETRVSCSVFMHPGPTAKIQPLPQVVMRDGGKPRYKEFAYQELWSNLVDNYSLTGFSAVESFRSS